MVVSVAGRQTTSRPRGPSGPGQRISSGSTSWLRSRSDRLWPPSPLQRHPAGRWPGAFFVLIGGQYLVSSLSVGSAWFNRVIKSEPRIVLHRGRLVEDALRRERVTHEELRAVARSHGVTDLGDIGAIVLETDGTFHLLSEIGAAPRGFVSHRRPWCSIQRERLTRMLDSDANGIRRGWQRIRVATPGVPATPAPPPV